MNSLLPNRQEFFFCFRLFPFYFKKSTFFAAYNGGIFLGHMEMIKLDESV